MTTHRRRAAWLFSFLIALLGLAACEETTGGFPDAEDDVFAPGVDVQALADGEGVPDVEVGHRLLAAGEFELAIQSFNRAALERGELDAEILSGLGTANLGLGRLKQAEGLLKRAIEHEDAQPVDYNNYAVLLMERGRTAEAVEFFKRGFALSNGENIAIRDNLRLALAKSENSVITEPDIKTGDYKLVRRGNSDYVLRPIP